MCFWLCLGWVVLKWVLLGYGLVTVRLHDVIKVILFEEMSWLHAY
jgi:hypothetical protein